MHPVTKQAIQTDIELAQQAFGAANIFWPPQLDFIRINNFLLPKFYNMSKTDVLIIYPPHYKVTNKPLEEFYLNKNLWVKTRSGWQRIPHYHSNPGLNRLSRQNWAWYCLHSASRSWSPNDNVLSFMKMIELLLNDPFK